MYGNKEMNHKRQKLLKELKGKQFTMIGKIGLYTVKNVVVDTIQCNMKLVFVETRVKHSGNSLLGSCKELVNDRDLYMISPVSFKKTCEIIYNKSRKFLHAESIN